MAEPDSGEPASRALTVIRMLEWLTGCRVRVWPPGRPTRRGKNDEGEGNNHASLRRRGQRCARGAATRDLFTAKALEQLGHVEVTALGGQIEGGAPWHADHVAVGPVLEQPGHSISIRPQWQAMDGRPLVPVYGAIRQRSSVLEQRVGDGVAAVSQ